MEVLALVRREHGLLVALAQRPLRLFVRPLGLEVRRDAHNNEKNALSEEGNHEELLHHAEQVADAARVVEAAVRLALLEEFFPPTGVHTERALQQRVPHTVNGWRGVLEWVVVAEEEHHHAQVVLQRRVENDVSGFGDDSYG